MDILGFAGFGCNHWTLTVKAAKRNMQMNGCGCVPIILYLLKKMEGQIWPKSLSLLIPDLVELYR